MSSSFRKIKHASKHGEMCNVGDSISASRLILSRRIFALDVHAPSQWLQALSYKSDNAGIFFIVDSFNINSRLRFRSKMSHPSGSIRGILSVQCEVMCK